jgi:hypothetical protein
VNAGNDAYLNVYATSSVVPVLVQWWYNGQPLGGETLIHWLFVRRDVERNFRRRQPRLRKIFDPRANLKDPRESG